jgi:hypothetical protein
MMVTPESFYFLPFLVIVKHKLTCLYLPVLHFHSAKKIERGPGPVYQNIHCNDATAKGVSYYLSPVWGGSNDHLGKKIDVFRQMDFPRLRSGRAGRALGWDGWINHILLEINLPLGRRSAWSLTRA